VDLVPGLMLNQSHICDVSRN